MFPVLPITDLLIVKNTDALEEVTHKLSSISTILSISIIEQMPRRNSMSIDPDESQHGYPGTGELWDIFLNAVHVTPVQWRLADKTQSGFLVG